MGKIFWGFLLVIFDLRINGIVFTPDFVGYILMFVGLSSFLHSRTVARYRWLAAVACALAVAEYMLTGFTESYWVDAAIGRLVGLSLSVLRLLVTYLVVAGVRDTEKMFQWELGGRRVFHSWLAMTGILLSSTLLRLMELGRRGNIVLAFFCLLAAFSAMIWYLVRLYHSKTLLEACQKAAQKLDKPAGTGEPDPSDQG